MSLSIPKKTQKKPECTLLSEKKLSVKVALWYMISTRWHPGKDKAIATIGRSAFT